MSLIKDFFKSPTNIHDAIIPLYIQCKLLGTAPFTYISKSKGLRKLKPTIAGLVHSLTFSLIFMAICVHGFWDKTSEKEMDVNFISQIATYVELYINVANSLLVIIFMIVHRQKYCEIFTQFQEVDSCLKQLGIYVNYKQTKKHVLIQIFILIVIFVCVLTGYFIVNGQNVTYGLTMNIPCLSSGTMIVTFSTLLFMLQQRFEILNRLLTKTYIKNETKINGFFNISNKVQHWDVIEDKPKKNIETYSEPSLHVMDKVFDMHDDLCEISKSVNMSFGFQILVSLMISFVTILTHVYYNTVNSDQFDEKSFLKLFWTGVHCLSILTIVVSCSKATEHADRARIILHRITNSSTDMKNATEMYSLQLLHQKVSFTACGFFPLDYTLVYSIVGALTTYLVILIQFNMSSTTTNNTTAIAIYNSTRD